MFKNIFNKLYWLFWYSTTIITGMLAGFMISHAIMLGRFFTWYVESDNMNLLRSTYSVFRKDSNPQILYNSFLYFGLISGFIWTILAFIKKKNRIIAVVAGLSTLWVSIIFRTLNFDYFEELIKRIQDIRTSERRFYQKITEIYGGRSRRQSCVTGRGLMRRV